MKWLQGAGTEGRVNRGACAATLQVLHYWENQEKKKRMRGNTIRQFIPYHDSYSSIYTVPP